MERGIRFSVSLLLAGFFSIAAMALASSGCAGYAGDAVGAPCRDHSDCPGNGRCLRGGDFPDGTCTIPCDGHYDCPGFAACIDKEGGVCLETCSRDRDCRSRYECSEERNRGSSGRTPVCIGD